MAEPQQRPVVRNKKERQGSLNRMVDKQTNDTTSRAGGSDSNSLLREISIRNNRANPSVADSSQPLSPTAIHGGAMPQIKGKAR